MPPPLYPAPPWQPDRSDFIVLWHGCTASDKNAIEAGGIDLSRCAVDTDFGRGFYTTTLERQAKHWAWDRFYGRQSSDPSLSGDQPVVLRFRVPRYTTDVAGLDRLDTLVFVRGEYGNEDYWSLVQHCRRSVPAGTAHGGVAIAHDHGRGTSGWYDLVVGPVSSFWEQRVVMPDSDQYSFHTGAGVRLLQDLVSAGKGRGPDGSGHPDSYQWYPVS